MHWTDTWGWPFAGIFAFGAFWLLMYWLRRRRRLVRVMFWVMGAFVVVFGLFHIGTTCPPGTSPFEAAFWRGIQLRDWPDILSDLLFIVTAGLVGAWFQKSVNAPRPIGYGHRSARADLVDKKKGTDIR